MSDRAPHPSLTAADRVRRNAAIVSARERGEGWSSIASRFSLSERHARRAYVEALRDVGRTGGVDAAEMIGETVAAHRLALRQLLELASAASNDSVKLGSITRRVAVARDLLGLLQATGAVPSGSMAFRRRVENDMRAFAIAVIDVLEARGLDYSDVESELDGVLGRPEVLAA